jgi:hypothetical protein
MKRGHLLLVPVGEGNYVGGFVDSIHELPVPTSDIRVWVLLVQVGVITGLAIGWEVAV